MKINGFFSYGEESLISFDPKILTIMSAEDDQPHLLGSKCSSCGSIIFPQQARCTKCFVDGTLKPCRLSAKGIIYAFARVERDPLASNGFQVPYVQGYVELPEGVRVLSKIIGETPETLKLGAPVKLVLESQGENPDGKKVIGFCFRVI